jgi:hypothetical protein
VDAQTVGVATAVISATTAALALMLSWYREHEGKRGRLFVVASSAILAAGTIGVAVVVTSDAPESESDRSNAHPPARLTTLEYRQRAGMICARRDEASERVARTRPRGSFAPVTVQIEAVALRDLQRLTPPKTLERSHRDAVALWTRRITLIEDILRQGAHLGAKEADAMFAEVERVTAQLYQCYKALGIRECEF